MKTIMILKIWRLFPDIYIIIAFIGICLDGARAISHAFFTFSVSVSTGLDAAVDTDCCVRFFPPNLLLVKPGGSGMLDTAFVGFGAGEFKATTHCGGGTGLRGREAMIDRKVGKEKSGHKKVTRIQKCC